MAIKMSIILYLDGNGSYWKILQHCLWSRKRGNELVDEGIPPELIIGILLSEEKQIDN